MSAPATKYRVLFVCTGNTCRSPLAVAAMKDELGEDEPFVEVSSAGTAAAEGAGASPESIEIAARDGLDLASHRARRLTPEIANRADLVIVMERLHAAAAERLGVLRDRVRVLSEWPEPGEGELPVSDPFGGSMEAYEECWRRIRRHVKRVVPQVREALRERSA